jgi:uncharacterized protein YdhG (YjbR/CyaY superfamily)
MLRMKKAKSRKRTSEDKKKRNAATVEEYVARVPQPARDALGKVRVAIRSVVPAEATEVISYGIPAFKHKKVLVWYAAFSDHYSLFPTASVIEHFKSDLAGFSTSKGTIHFPLDRPVPTALIKRLVKARVADVEGKG